MLSFIARRLVVAIPTLLILVILSFVLMYAAPGGPFTSDRPLPEQVLANIEAKYGLDQPFWKQIVNYVTSVVTQFDFGPSFQYKDRSVNDIIAQGFPVTLTYGFWSFVAACVVGISLGVAAVLNTNFIRTAQAKGLPMRRVVFKHALKPAMLPVLSYLGPTFVFMITGSVVIDIFFSTGGIGQYFVNSAFNRDYAVIMGITILVGAMTILFNLVVDLLYAWIDPKIRY